MRVGVIGTGNMGQHHARVYSQLPHLCELVGVYDLRQDQARQVAARYHTRAFERLEDLLDGVDAVSIAAPTALHHRIASETLEQGIATLVEKPIAAGLSEAEDLIETARARGTVLQVVHVERFNPAVVEIARILETERIIGISVERLSPFDPRISDVDVVLDLMIHDLDIVRSLNPGSDISRMSAAGRAVRSEVNVDYATATITFDNGVIAGLTASRVTEDKVRRLEVSTADAFVVLDYMERKITITRRTTFSGLQKPNYKQESLVEKVLVPLQEPLVAELEHFLGCARSGDKPRVSGEDGLEALRAAEAIRSQIYGINAGRLGGPNAGPVGGPGGRLAR